MCKHPINNVAYYYPVVLSGLHSLTIPIRAYWIKNIMCVKFKNSMVSKNTVYLYAAIWDKYTKYILVLNAPCFSYEHPCHDNGYCNVEIIFVVIDTRLQSPDWKHIGLLHYCRNSHCFTSCS